MARRTVERLMRADGLRGVSRAKGLRAAHPAPETGRPRDLVNHWFTRLSKTELIRDKGPGTCVNDVEIAVAGYVD